MRHHCSNTTGMWQHTASFCPLCFLLSKYSSIARFMLPYSIVPAKRYTGDSVSASFEYHVPWRTNTIRRGKHHHSPQMHLFAMTHACTEYYFAPSIPSNQFLPNVSFYHVVLEQKHGTRCSRTVASSYINFSVGVSSGRWRPIDMLPLSIVLLQAVTVYCNNSITCRNLGPEFACLFDGTNHCVSTMIIALGFGWVGGG
jgi:hypothetical protein